MIPKYIRLSNILREQLEASALSGANKLPTEKALCDKYHVSRQTIREALSILEKDNLIVKKQGSGTYINFQAKNQARRIAIIVGSDSDYIFPNFISELRTQFQKAGYKADIFRHENSYLSERALLENIMREGYSGIVVEPVKSSLPSPNAEAYEHLKSSGCKLLFIWAANPNLSSHPCIRADDVFGGYIAGKHLILNGHTNISLFLNRDDICGINRYNGFLTAASDYGIVPRDDMVCWYYDNDIRMLRLHDKSAFIKHSVDFFKKSTAVICQNDEVAYWLIKTFSQSGIRVPEDISIISFDNSYLSDFASSHITSLSHKKGELTAIICESLIRLINGETIPRTALSWKIIKRSSDIVLKNNSSGADLDSD